MATKPKFEFVLKITTYPNSPYVDCHIIKEEGIDPCISSGVLWGLILAETAEALAATLGLRIDRYDCPYEPIRDAIGRHTGELIVKDGKQGQLKFA